MAQKYGKNYLHDYGWAARALDPTNPKLNPVYKDIERTTNIKEIRHYYLLASQRIHAGASGSGAHLYPTATGGGYNTGPADTGLALPAVSTLMALQQTLSAFGLCALNDYDDAQPVVQFMALRRLTSEAADALNGTERTIATGGSAGASKEQDAQDGDSGDR